MHKKHGIYETLKYYMIWNRKSIIRFTKAPKKHNKFIMICDWHCGVCNNVKYPHVFALCILYKCLMDTVNTV